MVLPKHLLSCMPGNMESDKDQGGLLLAFAVLNSREVPLVTALAIQRHSTPYWSACPSIIHSFSQQAFTEHIHVLPAILGLRCEIVWVSALT